MNHLENLADTFIASNIGIALIARKTSADGTVVKNMALCMNSTVTRCHTSRVETCSIREAVTVSTAANIQWCVHCEGKAGKEKVRSVQSIDNTFYPDVKNNLCY